MKKYMNIPMARELYSKSICKEMAKEIAGEEKITGMSLSQLSCEIFAHAYIYYNFKFVPKCFRNSKIAKSFYNSVANGVDLEDDGDKWYRRAAYRLIWVLPALA
ncbi:MAG: hypothetical protein K5678_04320 [Acetatifactor sp.]|nr:hypothetical protein [Acetatifactor sp.]